MSPQVLSIYNNAKIFLSEEELRDLACAIEKDLGKKIQTKKTKNTALENWTLESVTERLLATQFRQRQKAP